MPKIHVTAWDPELMYPGKDQRVAAIDPADWGADSVAQQLLEMAGDDVHSVQSISFPTQGFEVPDDLFDTFIGAHSEARVLEPEGTDEDPTPLPPDTSAQRLVETARAEADQIIAEAQQKAAELLAEAKKETETTESDKTEPPAKKSGTKSATKTTGKE